MNGESPDSEHQFVNHNVISCVEIELQYSALQDEAKWSLKPLRYPSNQSHPGLISIRLIYIYERGR